MEQRKGTFTVYTCHFFIAHEVISWDFSPVQTSVRSRLLGLILAGNSSSTSAGQVTARWSRYGAETEKMRKENRNISPFEKLFTAPACLLGNLCIPAVLLRCPGSATGKKTHPKWPISKERNWEAHTEENRIPQALSYFLCFVQYSHQREFCFKNISCFYKTFFVRMLIFLP